MHIVGSDYLLNEGAKRIIIAGPPGSGKTTLGRRLTNLFDLVYVEIDALYHGENWVPRETFEQEIVEFAAQPNWVTEWQYSAARPILLARANIVVWLDLPTRQVQPQLWRRTFKRWATGEELWNGNTEPSLRKLLRRHEESILWWGWISRNKYRDLPTLVSSTAARNDLPRNLLDDMVIVRLRTRREVRHWILGNSELARPGNGRLGG